MTWHADTAENVIKWRCRMAGEPRLVCCVRWNDPSAAAMLWSSTERANRDGEDPPVVALFDRLWIMVGVALYGDYAICRLQEKRGGDDVAR